MLPVSDAFLAAIRGSHSIVSGASVLTPPGQTGTALIGTSLAVVSGQVTLDATADVRGTLDMTVAEPWPTGNTTNDLVPYGTEIAINRGIVFGNGVVQRVPLGIYRLTTVEQTDAPKGSLRLTGSDRMSVVIAARLEIPRSFSAATTFGTVMTTLVQAVLPAQTIQWLNTDGSTDAITPATAIGRVQIAETDRFGFLNDMIKSLGMVWYFDYRGILVIKPIPAAGISVWTADAGVNGVLVHANRSLTRDGVHNSVIATGEALDNTAPFTATAHDTDPTSVTYYSGPFGPVPFFYSSPFITTAAGAASAAAGQLLLNRGLPYNVDFTQVPNPALEPLDGITIVYPIDLSTQPHVVTELHVLQQVVIGLGVTDGMACTTKLTTNTGVVT